jgi:hypothetical protein
MIARICQVCTQPGMGGSYFEYLEKTGLKEYRATAIYWHANDRAMGGHCFGADREADGESQSRRLSGQAESRDAGLCFAPSAAAD